MKKRNQQIWMMICLIAVSAICLTGCKKTEPLTPPDEPVTEEKTVSFDLSEYKVYDIKELSFKFVLVKVRIKSDQPVSYSLADISTSEKLTLDATDQYLEELSRFGIYIGKQGVDFTLTDEQNSAVFTLFVPVIDRKAKTLTLTLIGGASLELDLTQNVTGTKEELGFVAEEAIGDGETYQVLVNRAMNITGEELYRNNEASSYPSTAELYAFRLKMISLNGDAVKITEAEYITKENSDTFIALDATYEKTEKRNNIIGISVKENDEGYLFFLTLNPEREEITYKGTLRLKINGSWYNVPVDL